MSEIEKTPVRRSRRWLLGAGSVSVLGGGAFAATWFNVFADASAEGALTVEDAHQQARDGAIYLVDIRRPDEWKRTGIGANAIPIDMRRKDFGEVLTSIFDATGPRPVALICARGVRSDRMNTAKCRNFKDRFSAKVAPGLLQLGYRLLTANDHPRQHARIRRRFPRIDNRDFSIRDCVRFQRVQHQSMGMTPTHKDDLAGLSLTHIWTLKRKLVRLAQTESVNATAIPEQSNPALPLIPTCLPAHQ